MVAKKAEPKPKKREAKQAEKAAAKKEAKSKTPSKCKFLPQNSLFSCFDKVMEFWKNLSLRWYFFEFFFSHLSQKHENFGGFD